MINAWETTIDGHKVSVEILPGNNEVVAKIDDAVEIFLPWADEALRLKLALAVRQLWREALQSLEPGVYICRPTNDRWRRLCINAGWEESPRCEFELVIYHKLPRPSERTLKAFLKVPGPLTQDLKICKWKELGLKSPKLSKYLAGRAMPDRLISVIIDWLKAGQLVLELTSAESDILNQSVSSHFRSCQTPGSPQCIIHEDLIPAAEKNLFLAVIRTPKGFWARAKVRRCLSLDGSRTVGWWVEPVYGQKTLPTSAHQLAHLLQQAGEEAYEWLGFPNNGPDVKNHAWDRGFEEMKTEEVLVPSALFGYQDTLSKTTSEYTLKFSRVSPRVFDINEAIDNMYLKFEYKKYRTIGIIEENFRVPKDIVEEEEPNLIAIKTIMRRKLRELRKFSAAEFIKELSERELVCPNAVWGIPASDDNGDKGKRKYGIAIGYEKRRTAGYFLIYVSTGTSSYARLRFSAEGELTWWEHIEDTFKDE